MLKVWEKSVNTLEMSAISWTLDLTEIFSSWNRSIRLLSIKILGFLITSNNLVLSQDGATTGHTGVYQQLSGLIVGNTYKLRINISTQSADGVITVETYSGLGSSATINPPSSDYIANVVQISHFFTAQSTNDTVLINFALYGTSGNLTISSMSITETATSPTLVYSDLNDGQVICDLYQEEDIPLSLSIDDFKKVLF